MTSKRAKTAALLHHLTLIELLFTLPLDVLRNSFAAQLSFQDKVSLRCVCKSACDLVGQVAHRVAVSSAQLSTQPLPTLTRWLSRFTSPTEVQLLGIPVEGPNYSKLTLLLNEHKAHLAHVNTLVLGPTGQVTLALCCMVRQLFPKLHTLEIQRALENQPLFDLFPDLTTLSLQYPVDPAQLNAFQSAVQLPKLQNLSMFGWVTSFPKLPNVDPNTNLTSLHVSIYDVDDSALDSISRLFPSLETLSFDADEVTVDCEHIDSFPNLVQLDFLVEDGPVAMDPDTILRLLQQPKLSKVTGIKANFFTSVTAYTVQAMIVLQHASRASTFPVLSLAQLSLAAFNQLLDALPSNCSCQTLTCQECDIDVSLWGKLPLKFSNLQDLSVFYCTQSDAVMLQSLLRFPHLKQFSVQAAALRPSDLYNTMLDFSSEDRSLFVDFGGSCWPEQEMYNDLLEDLGISSRFTSVLD